MSTRNGRTENGAVNYIKTKAVLHSANVVRVDDPRSEPRVFHDLTQKKMAEDAKSDIAICFVGEND